MKTTTLLRMTAMSLIAIGLMGCGGGSATGTSDQEKAVKLIADYAASNANAKPGVNDYDKAGVDGVIAENIDAVNAMIDKGVRSDYDSESEIQDLVYKIGQNKPAVLDRNFGDGEHDFIYGVVKNTNTNKTWLNNNLGAAYADTNNPNFNAQQQATQSDDFLAYGSLFQWGRKADGHELMTYTDETHGAPKHPTTTIWRNNNPLHNKFIKGHHDWRFTHSSVLWNGVNAVNNVCPAGYRVPTVGELVWERLSWPGSQNLSDAFSSDLKWTAAGYRYHGNGNMAWVGKHGYYYTSTGTNGTTTNKLYIDSTHSVTNGELKANGMAVRCIKN